MLIAPSSLLSAIAVVLFIGVWGWQRHGSRDHLLKGSEHD